MRTAAGRRTGRRTDRAIAIIGAACRLPGAPDLEAWWNLLAAGRDAVTTVPPDRFTQAWFAHPRRGEPGKSYTFAAGTLGDVAGFDPGAFGISPREAAEMDPQQRLLLEVAAEALEDAGLPPGALAGTETGVFVGGSLTDYGDLRQADAASGDRYFMTGSALSILANRIGNVFDLRGPAQTIDTACSSSLVALHWACEALRAGRIPAALVGGVNLLLSPFPFLGFARAGMLSPSGRCHAFDARADGYVRAEGAGAVLLKPLEDALAAGDAIRGVILATGVNAAGRTMGLSLPSQPAQRALIEQVLAESGVAPGRIAYFEAHGTGTAAGDPLEAGAIGEAIGRRRQGAPLPIGSAKTNIGHTEPASGMVGLLKAVLMLQEGKIPPSLHHETPNPAIDFQGLGLRVPTALESLPDRRRAVIGVNSFGFGGTNASVLVGAAPATKPAAEPAGTALPPLLLSARSAASLRALAAGWRDRLATTPAPALPALLRGAARTRGPFPHRLAVRGADAATLAARLAAWSEGAPAAQGQAAPGQGVAFVFSGNGAPFPGMAQAQLAANAGFAAGVAAADAALAPLLGWSVTERLAAGVGAEDLAASDIAQPLLFAVQHGIVAALAAEGIRPALCLGHSVGEVAAAACAGMLDLPTAARLVVARSRHQARTRGQGRMAALGASAEAARPVLEALGTLDGRGVEIAAVNAPESLTVAGPESLLARLEAEAAERRWSFLGLDLDYAFHSAAMDGLRAGLAADLAGLQGQVPQVPLISTVTGAPLPAEACGPEHWWRNLRDPVQFLPAIQEATGLGPCLFLEIGPAPVLQGYLRDALRAAGAEAAILPSLSKRDATPDPFPGLADRAWAAGADPRSGPAFAGPAARRGLPHTPFDRTRIWYARTVEATGQVALPEEHPLLGFRRGPEPVLWGRILDTALDPWLADHALAGQPVLPAAGMLEMALAAGRARHPEAAAIELREAAIRQVLPLDAEPARELRATLDGSGRFALESRRRLAAEPWTLHLEATVAALPALPEAAAPAPLQGSALPGEAIRAMASTVGLHYGSAFESLDEAVIEEAAGRATVRLRRPEAAPADAGFLLHPARLDGALQGLVGLLAGPPAEPGTGLVPVRVARLVVRTEAAPAAQAGIRLTSRGERSAAADLVLRDGAGRPVAVLEGCTLQRIRLPGRADPAEGAFRIALQPAAPLPGQEAAPRPDLAAVLAAARQRDAALDLGDTGVLLEGFCAAAAHAALSASPAAGGPQALALLEDLAKGGLAAPAAGGLRPVSSPDLPPAVEIWRQVLLEQPALAADLAWAALAAERLPQSLADWRAPPEPALAAGPPATGAGQARLAAVLVEAAAAFAEAWPRGLPLRVLELGAGPGPLTGRLAAALAGSGRHVRFVAAALPGRPAPPTPPDLPGLDYLAAAWDPLGPEAPPFAADLVIGLGAAARLRAGTLLPEALRQAAAPGAALLLAEPLPGPLLDLGCGQDPSWWAAPGGASPLPAMEGWAAALEAGGWLEAHALPLSAAPWPATLLAARAPAGAALLAAPKLRRIALFADAALAALRGPLAAALQSRGAAVAQHALAEAARMPPAALQGSLVVALAGGGEALAESLAALGRLAAAAEGAAPGFRLVTMGGQQPEEGRHDPAAAACFALGRVLANEHPGLKPRRIDLDPALPPEQAARRLASELLTEGDAEAEVTLTREARLVPRLKPGLPPAPPPAGPAILRIGQPGQIGTLGWAPLDLPPPGPGEVAIRIEAAGVNFRDLMWAQGLLPEEALLPGFAGPGLGMECAGVVEAAGEGAPFQPGDRVFGVAPRALATHAITRAAALAALPEGLDPAEAATVPVAFLTAVHALEELARIEPGERVLVHGGAGAVGLAALQVALAAGARVAATAGTPAKRAFLRAAGAELVLDSRDTGFADALRAVWPDGVDVVLNSLAGEAMERSMALLRPFGRFLELGKRDFAENRRVPLRPMRRNITWFAVDVDELPRARPQVAARLMRSIADRLRDGSFRPLPATDFAATEVEAAFRTLQASGHIGKLVVRPPAPAAAPHQAPALRQAARGTVLVVGGTQGFGLATARFLAAQGVRHLVLLSRRGAETPGIEAAVRDLAARGAAATVIACDAADAAALDRALRAVRPGLPPIRGVVHAAAAMADGAAAALEPARVARVLEAKLRVAEALDAATAEDPLALFLMFGSAVVAVGNPGQAAYVAANAGLEAIARRRRAAGRPAQVVAWGPIADAGMLAADEATARILRRRLGATPLPAEEALAALPALLEAGPAAIGHARLAWGEARAALAILEEPCFEAVRSAAAPAGDAADLRARLRDAPEAEALALLREALAAELARILRLPAASVAPDAPLGGLGLDSLGGMELRLALEQRLGMPVPLSAVTETLTVEALARRMAEALRSAPAPEAAAAAALVAAHEAEAEAGPAVRAA
ncbi:type I polyketide synthase [Paracraurococcus lichenis]|uniref:SDR family NAD(P)-dependent oxidoreductase n=1 Tax=Paracraurococcus lichenis TaxID=3064888 RepID=A0ABT9E7R5_9PROT|nr:type I polyketide synthase [Paracraurococcus sp. LOR1-02]MDO9711998.1 SDR family NAD(P)-dependent oxidoreductase [Paracraurococcus sp. LOR1-02]